jgi:hypothetical protein
MHHQGNASHHAMHACHEAHAHIERMHRRAQCHHHMHAIIKSVHIIQCIRIIRHKRIMQEVRIIHKTGKDGRPGYSFAFAEFENAECAAAALSCLNGYQYDPDDPKLGAMQLRYARQDTRNRSGSNVTRPGGGPEARATPRSNPGNSKSPANASGGGGAGVGGNVAGQDVGSSGGPGKGGGGWQGRERSSGEARLRIGGPPTTQQFVRR